MATQEVKCSAPSPIRSFNESISVSAKDGHYHEVASLHVRIITKRASNSRNLRGWGGGGGGGGVVTRMEGGATRVWGLQSQSHRSDVRAIFSNAMTLPQSACVIINTRNRN